MLSKQNNKKPAKFLDPNPARRDFHAYWREIRSGQGDFPTITRLLAKSRSLPSQGLFRTLPSYQSVADPPPSRLIASSHPSRTRYVASSSSVIPSETPACRPSTTTRNRYWLCQPMAERGWRSNIELNS